MKNYVEKLIKIEGKGVRLETDRLVVENSKHSFPVLNGIIDLLPSLNDPVSLAYDKAPARKYDNMITASRWYTRLYLKLVWNEPDPWTYINKVLSFIPDDFQGVLLDVPVGTGILTVEHYKRLKKAVIIAFDYSPGMLAAARERYRAAGLKNVIYIRGDIASLPFRDKSIDFILTMNGFHAFPRKDKALQEMKRVAKGEIGGCFYVKGEQGITDFVAGKVFTKMKVFTPPYFTQEQACNLLEKDYTLVETGTKKSIFYFHGRRRKSVTAGDEHESRPDQFCHNFKTHYNH